MCASQSLIRSASTWLLTVQIFLVIKSTTTPNSSVSLLGIGDGLGSVFVLAVEEVEVVVVGRPREGVSLVRKEDSVVREGDSARLGMSWALPWHNPAGAGIVLGASRG